jgi:hypothetical protein
MRAGLDLGSRVLLGSLASEGVEESWGTHEFLAAERPLTICAETSSQPHSQDHSARTGMSWGEPAFLRGRYWAP